MTYIKHIYDKDWKEAIMTCQLCEEHHSVVRYALTSV